MSQVSLIEKLHLFPGKKGISCNIDFAKSAFDFIKLNNNEKTYSDCR